ncbi:MAG: hypothetical protein KDC24_01970 [Saprospiraceae bacterium]|nr:hypothetical protein [Saprospiraceae bacterium]
MKKSIFGLATFLFVSLSLFVNQGCHNNPSSPNGNPTITPTTGFWQVTYFFDRKDETIDYQSYLFDFQNNGVVVASNSSANFAGTWRVYMDDGRQKMDLDFAGTHPSALEELEDDWNVIEMTDTFMHLENVSGGDGHVETLKMEKR